MEFLIFWLVLALALVALGAISAVTILIWRERSLTRSALVMNAKLLERAIDQLSTTRADEFVRMRRAAETTLDSTSPRYPPSDPAETATETRPSAYQEAKKLGVDDDTAQFLE